MDIVTAEERFIKMREVLVMTGLGKSTIYRLMAANQFPASRSYEHSPTNKFWLLSDVSAWQRQILGAPSDMPEERTRDPFVYFDYAVSASGLSMAYIQLCINDGSFPAGFPYQNSSSLRFWYKSEIDEWVKVRSAKPRKIKAAAQPLTDVTTSNFKIDETACSLAEVLRKTGLTQAALCSLIVDGKFPKGIIEGRYRKRRWRAEVVERWLSEQSEVREETCSYLALIG